MLISEHTSNKASRGTGYNGVRDFESPLKYVSLRDSDTRHKINLKSKLKDKSREKYSTNSRGDQSPDSRGPLRQRSPIQTSDSINLSPEYCWPKASRRIESSLSHSHASKSEIDEHLSNFSEIMSRRPDIRKRPISVSRRRSSRLSSPIPDKSIYMTKNSKLDVQTSCNIYLAPIPASERTFEAQPPSTSKPRHMRTKSKKYKTGFSIDVLPEEESKHLQVPIQATCSNKFRQINSRRVIGRTGNNDLNKSMVNSTNSPDIFVESTFSLDNKSFYNPDGTQCKTDSTTPNRLTGSISPCRTKTYKQQIIQERLPKQKDHSLKGISNGSLVTDSTGLTSPRTENSLASLGSSQMISASLSRGEAIYTISFNESTETDQTPIQTRETLVRSVQELERPTSAEIQCSNSSRESRLGLFYDPMFEGVHGIAKRWKVSKNIGNGGISQVYKAMDVNLGTIFAVKRISYTAELNSNLRVWEKEIKILEKYKHYNIIQYLGSECEAEQLYIYLEYADGGSLSSLLSRVGPFEEKTVQNYVGQILKGLSYLHRNDIIHRDIKAENVLLDRGTIKLSDFGCSRQYSDRTKSGMINSVAGTFLFMAPEVIRSEHYGRSIDIWSLGCLTIQLLTARSPWPEFDNIFNGVYRIGNGLMPIIPDSISQNAKDFINCCLNHDPSKRKTADELIGHRFIVSSNYLI